ncbi:MAG TPA: patatin-like phospholipase family protein, partial [Pyrinomonadaceae bacterium]
MTVKDPGAKPASAQNTEKPLKLSQVLAEEFARLHHKFEFKTPTTPASSPKQEKEEEDKRRKEVYDAIHGLKLELEQKPWALCLSGGGIRSATFCLGVLQGLASRKLLERFDYLSTVSGGGYIGSWLTAWIHRDGIVKVNNALANNQKLELPPEHAQICHLRAYSNYLSPKIGLFSVDTWTLVTIYLRNLFLNWLVFIPLLMAGLLIPRIYASLIRRNSGLHFNVSGYFSAGVEHYFSSTVQTYIFLGAGLFFGAVALAYIGSHRPSLRKPFKTPGGTSGNPGDAKDIETKPDQAPTDPDNQRNFLRWCMLPLALSILLLTVGRAWYLSTGKALNLRHFIAGGAALHGVGWVFTNVAVVAFFGRDVLRNYWRNKLPILELGIVVLTGALGGLLLWLLSIPEKIGRYVPVDTPELYACFDGPQLLLVFLFMGILSVGLGGRSMTTDEDREWWARAGAWLLIVAVVWAALNALVLYGPMLPKELLLNKGQAEARDWLGGTMVKGVLIPFGIISGFVTILFGVSAKTPANERQAEKAGRLTTLMDYAVKLAAPIFVLSLVVALSLLTDLLILLIKNVPKWSTLTSGSEWSAIKFPTLDHHAIINNSSFLFLACLFLSSVAISLIMARCINVNEFSLHAMYRNRLIRAYLGASRKRMENRFTGFDPDDDLRMSELWPNENAPPPGKQPRHPNAGKPLHIVNMTWNLVQGKNLAWQHRKATTFTASPLHCGSYLYGYRRSEKYGGRSPETISLGTAFTISGAAASPNMGYYSSAAVTFLMTLFNARLGWWLGNPVKEKYQKSGPTRALKPMFDEAFGKTVEDKDYVYLSDGGHFENLGLYEMVLRRCHTIFVIDASSDPDHKFENLGNAIRRIRVDL